VSRRLSDLLFKLPATGTPSSKPNQRSSRLPSVSKPCHELFRVVPCIGCLEGEMGTSRCWRGFSSKALGRRGRGEGMKRGVVLRIGFVPSSGNCCSSSTMYVAAAPAPALALCAAGLLLVSRARRSMLSVVGTGESPKYSEGTASRSPTRARSPSAEAPPSTKLISSSFLLARGGLPFRRRINCLAGEDIDSLLLQ